MTSMIKRFVFALTVAAAVAGVGVGQSFAGTLDEARAQGLIGERPDGLVGAVAAAPAADIKVLVDSVNVARMASYKDVAQKNGTPMDAVQMIAGEKQIQKANENKWYVLDPVGRCMK